MEYENKSALMKLARGQRLERLNSWFEITINQLNHLDPILAIDLEYIRDETGDVGQVMWIWSECLTRVNVWGFGTTIRQAWLNAMTGLFEITRLYDTLA
jgi:hypothetical protein